MAVVTVSTDAEFVTARASNPDQIVAVGDAAETLRRRIQLRKVAKLSLLPLMVLIIAAAGAFLTRTSTASEWTPAAIGALAIALATAVVIVLAVLRGYEEIEISAGKVVLRKKAK